MHEPFELDIIRYAETAHPRECCGVLIRDLSGLKAVPLPNVAPDCQNAFLMAPSAYLPYLKDGTLLGYYHSHPSGDERLSEADKKISEAAGLPVTVYSTQTKKFNKYEPTGYVFPLEGRRFILGVFDCFTLVEDYYKELLKVTITPVVIKLANIVEGLPSIRKLLEERDFVVTETPQLHDVLCLSIGVTTGDCNHVGIYLGNDKFLHQVLHRPSSRSVYGGYWVKHTVCIARHKSQIK